MGETEKPILFEFDQLGETGDRESALKNVEDEIGKAQKNKQGRSLIKAKIRKAKILYRFGEFENAARVASEVYEGKNPSFEAVDAGNLLGLCAFEANDLNLAEEYFQSAISLSRKLEYPYGLGWSLHHLALQIYLTRGQFDLALSTMEEAGYFKKIANCEHWGSAIAEAIVNIHLENRKKARKALDDLLTTIKPATRLAGVYFYLWARISLDEQEMNKADEYLRLALRIANQTGVNVLNVWVRIEKSRYYRLLGQPATALPWAEDALGYANRAGNLSYIGSAVLEKALVAWENGDLKTAENSLKQARDSFKKIDAAFEHAKSVFLLSAFYHHQNHPLKETTFLEAANLIKKGGFESILEKEKQRSFPVIASYFRDPSPQIREITEGLMENLARIPPTPLHILGFGQFRVLQGKQLIPDQAWQRRKAGELFRYLLLQNEHSAPREMLIETLWPDMPPATAMANFHQATSTLRRIFEADLPEKFPSRYLTIEGERVFLHIPSGSTIDFEVFEAKIPSAILNLKLEELNSIVSMYSDDLFPMDRYADWSIDRRARLEELYINGLLKLGELYLLYQENFKAVDCSKKVLKRDPWNENAVFLGMKAYSNLSNIPRALTLYYELETSLAADLGIKPRQDLRNFAEEIKLR